MLAALNINKYPYFDTSEIISEPDFLFSPYRSVKPVKAGSRIPDFTFEKATARWQQFFNGAKMRNGVLLNQLSNKPLVISFYSGEWQSHGLNLLKQLNQIHHEIKVQGGNLLIISAENDRKLEKLAWENSLSLNVYFDTDNEIAGKFRVYSDEDPIWNRFSGIDTNVPLLATYVISASGQIIYDHIDQDFSDKFPAKDIITSINRSNLSSQIV